MAKVIPLIRVDGSITSFAATPEDYFFTEQGGRVWKFNLLTNDFTCILDITDLISNLYEKKPMKMPFPDERGLLKIAIHPEFNTPRSLYEGTFFIVYSDLSDDRKDDHISRLAQLRYSPDKNAQEIRNGMVNILNIPEPQANHNMGELLFDLDGYLWVGVGDGGGANDQHGMLLDLDDDQSFLGNAQDPKSLHGKLLRIEPQQVGAPYLIPQNNPFSDDRSLGEPEIAAWGFRNPWSMSLTPNGNILVGDVGQNRRESIKLVTSLGENHGWRAYEGIEIFSNPVAEYISNQEVIPPLLDYGREYGVAITGVLCKDGRLIFVDLKGNVMTVKDGEIEIITSIDESIHGMGKDLDGNVFILTYKDGVGSIQELVV